MSHPGVEPSKLGSWVASYRYNPVSSLGFWGFLTSIVGLIFVPAIWFAVAHAILQEGIEGVVDPWLVIGAFVGTGLFLLSVFLTLSTWLGRRDRLDLYREGFIFREGHEKHIWRYDEIDDICHIAIPSYDTSGRILHINHRFLVYGQGKPDICLSSDLHNVVELGAALQKAVSRHHLPRLLARFEQGRTVRFGPLIVDKEGIRGRGYQIPWGRMDEARFHTSQGRSAFSQHPVLPSIAIHHRAAGPNPLEISTSGVANGFLVTALLNSIVETGIREN